MKAFVTGADGLLGANLVRSLLDKGHTVKAFVLPNSGSPVLEGLDIEKVEGDLLNPDLDLADMMGGCEGVFHCAAITDQWADTDFVWQVNYEGAKKVLAACLSAKIKRLVQVGSASSYKWGTIEEPGDETGGYPPEYHLIAYMESKRKATEKTIEYVRDKGLDAVIVCPTFMLGPYDFGPSSGELVRQFIKNKVPFASPGGRNFAYAPDVADAAASAYEKGRKGQTYLLGGHNMTYFEFFSRVADIAGTPPPKLVLPGFVIKAAGAGGSAFSAITGRKVLLNLKMAKLSLYGTYYSTEKAEKELGLKKAPIEKAITESIESLKEYGHL